MHAAAKFYDFKNSAIDAKYVMIQLKKYKCDFKKNAEPFTINLVCISNKMRWVVLRILNHTIVSWQRPSLFQSFGVNVCLFNKNAVNQPRCDEMNGDGQFM